jgi:VWFA-related protein
MRDRRLAFLLGMVCLASCWIFREMDFGLPVAHAQQSTAVNAADTTASHSPTSQTASSQDSAELTSHDETTTFKVNVKLVVLRVVVRDSQGHALGNLQKEDFQVFDKSKPQVISQFSLEQPGIQAVKEEKTAEKNPMNENQPAASVPPGKPLSVPERFVAYLFDDEHLQFANLAQVRDAAQRHFKTLRPTDRAAVFTTSGKTMLDFTDDQTKLQDAILHLRPRLDTSAEINPCPDISYYMADLIVNKSDSDALRVGILDYINCSQTSASTYSRFSTQAPAAQRQAQQLVSSTAQQVLSKGDMETHLSLGILKDVVNRISRMPGQRSVILVSPGFLTPQMEYEYTDIIDRAVHSQVLVSAIDARGLYVIIPGGDASKRGITMDPDPKETGIIDPAVLKSQYQAHSATDEADTLSSFADGTGGTFFHNSNDFDEGFRRVAQTPEYSYILGFSPQNLKPDGSFHNLKVTLKNPGKVTLQARRGYFAPKGVANPEEQAKQEMEDALFSQEEMHDLPVELHTQFFKASDDDAKLTVLAHVDLKRLRFRKTDGRNEDVLTCSSAVFNRDGNYLQGIQKTVTMHLKDETLEHELAKGMTLKTSFDVKPGSYLVRLVVRDSEGQLMSAESGAVEIP